jgi:hypothetical protein
MRRLTRCVVAGGLTAATALVSCNSPDLPTGPSDSSIRIEPRFAFTGGSGTLLAVTTDGELVLIDLDADSISLIGDAGSVGGSDVAWFDIAFDDEGTLIGVTELGTSCLTGQPCSHLYEIDPETGGINQEIGSTGEFRIRGIDFADDSLFGSGYGSDLVGNLFTIDAIDGSASAIPNDTATFGINPFDGLSRPIAPGGFAVHPSTGELWGIENEDSRFSVLYRIDRSTGVADSIMAIGVNGTATEVPFIGLHILDDGTFVAVRDLASGPDSAVYEVSSVPDSSSGLAEIAVIPLAVDSAITGPLVGLEAGSPPSQDTLVLSLTADTTELHPWIRYFEPFAPAPFIEPGRLGDDATLTVTVTLNGQPLESQEVSLRAEFLDSIAGHVHVSSRVDIADGHLAELPDTTLAGHGKSVLGMFAQGGDTTTTVTDDTDSEGAIALTFITGFVSGELDVIASISHGGNTIEDTLRVFVRVPDLVDLDDNSTITSNALMVGETAYHLGGDNRNATTAFEDALEVMVAALQTDSTYLQLNDASLPRGGAFTVTPPQISTGVRVEQPGLGHRTHAEGIDQDIGLCYASSPGFDEANNEISGSDCLGGQGIMVDELLLEGFGFTVLREEDHFHLRLEQP